MNMIEVNNVSIRYMTGDFKNIGLKEYVVRRLKNDYNVVEFWANKDISFKLEKGDMLGIIGTNGAGKSTLLKALSGIMEPTRGKIRVNGTIAALLELGSGFDKELTVRENTYLRGAMLGYTRKFMDDAYDQIIDFAELREFQDRPFKQLSSGMKSRLAFSIASLVKPDILILDEVLAVGDGSFRSKSEAKMKEVIGGGATTILVSHSVTQVRKMCNKVLWLHKGEQVEFGDDVQGICDRYERFLGSKEQDRCDEKKPDHPKKAVPPIAIKNAGCGQAETENTSASEKSGKSTGKKKKTTASTTRPETPYGTSISGMTREGIEFYWKKPEIAAGYEVFRSYEKDSPGEKIAVIRRRDIGTYIDSDFDRSRKKVFYSVRSFIDKNDGKRVFSERTEPVEAVCRKELALERDTTYLYSGTSRKIRAFYGWGESENVKWSSDNEKVATIRSDGTIQAVASGECTIKCCDTESGNEATARVVVDRKAPEPLGEIVTRYRFNQNVGCWENPCAQKTHDAVIMMAGDLMCGKRQMQKQRLAPNDWNFNGSFTYAKDIISQSDFAIGNLETLLAAGWSYIEDELYIRNKSNCNAPSRYLDAVRYGGFDAVAMANDHNCDGGKSALLETIEQVDKYKLARTGVFANKNENRFFIANVNGIKVGFLAYVSAKIGYNDKDLDWAQEDIDTILNTFSASKAKKDIATCRAAGAEFVVVYMHWGFENFRNIAQHQQEDAQKVADAGADYIVGSNPHLLQPCDMIAAKDGRKVPCVYSVGNFQAVLNHVEGNRDSVLMRIRLKKDETGRVYLAENHYIPCHTYMKRDGHPWTPVAVSERFNVDVKKDSRKKFYRKIVKTVGKKIDPM